MLFFRCGKISGMKLGSRYRVAAVSFVVLVVASVGIEASPQGPILLNFLRTELIHFSGKVGHL